MRHGRPTSSDRRSRDTAYVPTRSRTSMRPTTRDPTAVGGVCLRSSDRSARELDPSHRLVELPADLLNVTLPAPTPLFFFFNDPPPPKISPLPLPDAFPI